MSWGRYKSSPSFRLFLERQNFLTGFTSVFDLYKPLEGKYNTDSSTHEADQNSLKSDWMAVGQDMRSALKKYERTT